MDWGTRHKIALGTAEGLVYLHEGCHRRIIHKDIKASNILLTEDFDPQVTLKLEYNSIDNITFCGYFWFSFMIFLNTYPIENYINAFY